MEELLVKSVLKSKVVVRRLFQLVEALLTEVAVRTPPMFVARMSELNSQVALVTGDVVMAPVVVGP